MPLVRQTYFQKYGVPELFVLCFGLFLAIAVAVVLRDRACHGPTDAGRLAWGLSIVGGESQIAGLVTIAPYLFLVGVLLVLSCSAFSWHGMAAKAQYVSRCTSHDTGGSLASRNRPRPPVRGEASETNRPGVHPGPWGGHLSCIPRPLRGVRVGPADSWLPWHPWWTISPVKRGSRHDWCQRSIDYEKGLDRSRVIEVAKGARKLFEGLPGLRFKFFTLDENRQQAMNFDVWESSEAAELSSPRSFGRRSLGCTAHRPQSASWKSLKWWIIRARRSSTRPIQSRPSP